MVGVFVALTVGVYSSVMVYVLKNVGKPTPVTVDHQ